MLKQRLRSSGRAIYRAVSPKILSEESSILNRPLLPNLRRKASNTLSAVEDTYHSVKQAFEGHRLVFTIGLSVASLGTTWAGYCLREVHNSKIDQRLEKLEHALKDKYSVEHEEIKKIVSGGSVSTAACLATAFTSLAIGYGLGWRGGAWYANRKVLREQQKLLGQLKPQRWQVLRKNFVGFRRKQRAQKSAEAEQADTGSLVSEQVMKTT